MNIFLSVPQVIRVNQNVQSLRNFGTIRRKKPDGSIGGKAGPLYSHHFDCPGKTFQAHFK
jgi:hypothetical protein